MKVFISWSGERSLGLAQALHSWLPLVLQYVDPWLSKADIEAGQRWDDDLSKKLSECNFGISCVTRDNMTAPWLLFEAGALAKSVDNSKLVPLLLDLDIKDFSGPLSRFQAKKVDKAGISDILFSINKDAATPVPDTRLSDLLEMAWDNLEEKIEAIPDTTSPATKPRTQSDILEELVAGVRSVESRIRDFSDDDDAPRRRRRLKFFPPMIHELMGHLTRKRDDPILLVVFASFFREDVPWLYELAMLAYRAITAGEIQESRRALESFRRGVELVMHGPFSRELGYDRERIHMVMMEMEALVEGDLVERFAVKVRRSKLPKMEVGDPAR
jgi:hypothetical protein